MADIKYIQFCFNNWKIKQTKITHFKYQLMHHNIIMYINNGYSFWDLLKFIFNSVIKILMPIKIKFKWALDDSKVKIKELSMHN